jgi:hypothetical protein
MRAASAGLSRPAAAADIARVLAGLAAQRTEEHRPAGEGREATSSRGQYLLGALSGDQADRRYRPQQRDLGTAPADR